MNAHTLLFCLFSIIPYYSIPEVKCEAIQINHFYDNDGKIVFDQMLYMDKIPYKDGYKDVAIGWVLLRNSRFNDPVERKKWEDDVKNAGLPYVPKYVDNLHISGNSVLMFDVDKIVRIRFKTIIYESWTQYDPELDSRQFFPKELYAKPAIFHKFNGKIVPFK